MRDPVPTCPDFLLSRIDQRVVGLGVVGLGVVGLGVVTLGVLALGMMPFSLPTTRVCRMRRRQRSASYPVPRCSMQRLSQITVSPARQRWA